MTNEAIRRRLSTILHQGIEMTSSGAESAYRGYRHQALYTLFRILADEKRHRLTFRPEGEEDLAIYDDAGHLLEVVQVKSYSTPLSLSDFFPSNKRAYLRRTTTLLAQQPDVTAKLVSFGPFGREMELAWQHEGSERQSITQKLHDIGFSLDEISNLLTSVELEQVVEDRLREHVFSFLEGSLVGGDPENAFDLLTYWLYVAAERRQQITYASLVERIHSIGQYFAERETYLQEWYRTVIPIDDRSISDEEQQQYAQEYYRGIAARYDHILSGADIIRPGWLNQIHQKFELANVVIVHGASGQGKSSLAFRYLHDYVPQQWRFMVQAIDNRQHALNIARALSGHANAVGAPVLVYVDVSFRDVGWVDLIRQLAQYRNLSILVTIREEDWRRVLPSGSEFRFEEIEITLNEEEAQELYSQLVSHSPSEQFLTFTDAWRRFGEGGPLLEFVHLVTQNEFLRDTLQQQIHNLEDRVRRKELTPSELQLLRLVAVASSYEARIDLPGLVAFLNLPAPSRTLELFEQEYLVRRSQDGSWIEGLHSIRSEFMAEFLTDEDLSLWIDQARQCIPLILDGDLEGFLLYAFSRRSRDSEPLLQPLNDNPAKTWTGIAGTANALLWLGIREYVEANHSLINEANEVFGPSSWWLAFDFDIASASSGDATDWWENLSLGTEETRATIRGIRSRQTPKETAFDRLAQWLESTSITPRLPDKVSDWFGLAQVAFWMGYLQINAPIGSSLNNINFEEATANLPLEYVGDLILGLSYGWRQFDTWFSATREQIIERFQSETNTVAIEDNGEIIRAHFIIDLGLYEVQGESDDIEVQEPDRNRLHSEAMRRVRLLRKLIPDRQRYGCQGYGHRMNVMPLPHDDTTKTGIPVDMLPPFWVVRVNSILGNLGSFNNRLASWREYSESILEFRQSALKSLQQLQRTLEIYFRRQNETELVKKYIDADLWQQCHLQSIRTPLLPKAAVDEWGFTGDSASDEFKAEVGAFPQQTKFSMALWQHQAFLKVFRQFSQSLNAFYNQSIHTLQANPHLGRNQSIERSEIERILGEHGIRTEQVHLTVYNLADALKNLGEFQTEFHERFAHLLNEASLSRLERAERVAYKQVWNIWFQFAFHPHRLWQRATQESDSRSKSELVEVKRQIKRGLRQLTQRGIRGQIATEDILWNGQPALWMVFDVDSPIDLYSAFEAVFQLVNDAIRSGDYHDLKHYVLGFKWPTILLVPLVRGRSVDQNAWRILTEVASIQHDQQGDDWWRYVPQPIPQGVWEQLGFSVWENERIASVNEFRGTLASLMILLYHVCDFRELPDGDEVGSEILSDYIAKLNSFISEIFQKVIDHMAYMLDYYNTLSEEEQTQRVNLEQAIHILIDSHSSIMPTADFAGELQMDLEGLQDWANRLAEEQRNVETLRLYWLADVMDDFGEPAH